MEDAELAKERADKAALACENIVIGYGFIPVGEKGTGGGVAPLDKHGIVPATHLPGYIDPVYEGIAVDVFLNETGVSNARAFIIDGENSECDPCESAVYYDIESCIQYRWSGSAFVSLGTNVTLGETHNNAYYGDK